MLNFYLFFKNLFSAVTSKNDFVTDINFTFEKKIALFMRPGTHCLSVTLKLLQICHKHHEFVFISCFQVFSLWRIKTTVVAKQLIGLPNLDKMTNLQNRETKHLSKRINVIY